MKASLLVVSLPLMTLQCLLSPGPSMTVYFWWPNSTVRTLALLCCLTARTDPLLVNLRHNLKAGGVDEATLAVSGFLLLNYSS